MLIKDVPTLIFEPSDNKKICDAIHVLETIPASVDIVDHRYGQRFTREDIGFVINTLRDLLDNGEFEIRERED